MLVHRVFRCLVMVQGSSLAVYWPRSRLLQLLAAAKAQGSSPYCGLRLTERRNSHRNPKVYTVQVIINRYSMRLVASLRLIWLMLILQSHALYFYLGKRNWFSRTQPSLPLLLSINKWYTLAIRDLMHFISTAWLICIFSFRTHKRACFLYCCPREGQKANK